MGVVEVTGLGGACPRARAATVLLLTLAGLATLGRLAVEAWMIRPTPNSLPRIAAPPPTRPSAMDEEAPPFLLVIVDGLRAELAADGPDPAMPFLAAFAWEGASGVALTGEPTLTTACVRTIVTGRNPDPFTVFRNFDAEGVEGDLIGFLTDRGARAVHGGDATLIQMCGKHYRPADVLAFPDRGSRDQGETDDLSFAFLLGKVQEGADLATLHLVRPDHAGHMYGAMGAEYRNACRIVDGQLRTVVREFRTHHRLGTILIAADHGVTPRGNHGGGEAGARRAPFALVGPRIAKLRDVEIPQSALAPTISAALGLPPPPLAESPPELRLTTLDESEKAQALDAYLQARIEVANRLGWKDEAQLVETRRAAIWVAGAKAPGTSQFSALYSDLEKTAFSGTGPLPAILALLFASLWIATLVRISGATYPERTAVVWPALAALIGGFALPVLLAATLVLAACAFATWKPIASRPGGRTLVFASIAAVPILGGAGLVLQEAYDATVDAGPAALRTGLVAAVLGIAFLALLARRRTREGFWRLAEDHPGLLLALGGVSLGFPMTMRYMIDPHLSALSLTRLVYAAAALLAVALVVRSKAVRSMAPRVRWTVAAIALAVLGGGRLAEWAWHEEWMHMAAGTGTVWEAVAAAVGALLLLDGVRGMRRARSIGGAAGLALAVGALVTAFVYRHSGAVIPWRISLLASFAAFAITFSDANPDGRLAVRLLAALSLARLLEPSDAAVAAFAAVAVLARFASALPVPRTRLGIAGLAVALLAVRIAAFHVTGHTESFSTVDVGGGFAPGGAAPAEGQSSGGGITPEILQATALLCLQFALVWIVLLSAAARAFERSASRDGLRSLVADLAVTFAARGAVIAAAMWVWWKSVWWVRVAYPVYALGAGDVILLLAALVLVGGFRRDRREEIVASSSGEAALPGEPEIQRPEGIPA